jgi:hypothetical protein
MGVRRESVTQAALKLQIAGCIRYQRGHILVIDRIGLESRSCECYRVANRETDRLLQMSQSANIAFIQAATDRVGSGRSEPSARHASSSFVLKEVRQVVHHCGHINRPLASGFRHLVHDGRRNSRPLGRRGGNDSDSGHSRPAS